MSVPPSFTFPRHQKNPKTYTVPYKAARSSWYIQPYIPHSYKILVPLIKIGERSPLSTKELIQFDNRLDRQGFVKLPDDVRLYLQRRGMQHEIQVWRERLTQLRNRLKRVNFPEAGGYIILSVDIRIPRDPQHLRDDPKPLAELLEDFFGPIQKDQLTPTILMFYQKRELDRDTRIFDDWEALFWPKLSPYKQIAEIDGGWPSWPKNRDLKAVKAEPTRNEQNLKASVEDVPEIPKPREQMETSQALVPLGKVLAAKAEHKGTSTPLVPPAVTVSGPHGTSLPTVRFEDDIALTSAITVHLHDRPNMPITPGPTPQGTGRDTQSTQAPPVPPIPGLRLVSETKSAQVRRVLDRFGSQSQLTPTNMFPQVRSTPVNSSACRPFPSGKPTPDSTSGLTGGRAQEGGSIDGRPKKNVRRNVLAFTEYDKLDNLTFVLQRTNVYSNLKAFERWARERILTPFIVITTLFNSLLVCLLAWEWKYGSYEARVAEAHVGQAPSRQDFSFDDSRGFRSGKLREQPNIRELDENRLPLSSYELEREKELEWDKMAYLLDLLAEDRAQVGELQDFLWERI